MADKNDKNDKSKNDDSAPEPEKPAPARKKIPLKTFLDDKKLTAGRGRALLRAYLTARSGKPATTAEEWSRDLEKFASAPR